MASNDYYNTLGVSKSATDAEIKNAYRSLAKKYHPDRFAQSSDAEKKEAEAKFKEINEAYSVLSDPQKKSNYDNYGSADGPSMGGGSGFWGGTSGGGFDDIFSSIFSNFTGGGRGSARSSAIDGDDIEYQLNLSFKEAAFGVQKEITFTRTEECADCHGTGAKNGTAYKTCPKCNGSGSYVFTQSTPFGQIRNQRVCDACRGTGRTITDKCTKCNGAGYTRVKRTVTINVPAGVNAGQMMTYRGEGEAGRNGGQKGNLIIVLSVKPHELFRRDGNDLYIDIPLTFTQAALGCKIDIPTLADPVNYTIPEGTQTGTTFRIKGKGIKYLKKETCGDLYFTVVVETPRGLNARQKELLNAMDNASTPNQYQKQKQFYDTLKRL